MVVLDGNCAVGCGPGTDCPYIHIFQCTLERTDAITNEDLEPVTFVQAYHTVHISTKNNTNPLNYASVGRYSYGL